jgi:hypothetical protein
MADPRLPVVPFTLQVRSMQGLIEYGAIIADVVLFLQFDIEEHGSLQPTQIAVV